MPTMTANELPVAVPVSDLAFGGSPSLSVNDIFDSHASDGISKECHLFSGENYIPEFSIPVTESKSDISTDWLEQMMDLTSFAPLISPVPERRNVLPELGGRGVERESVLSKPLTAKRKPAEEGGKRVVPAKRSRQTAEKSRCAMTQRLRTLTDRNVELKDVIRETEDTIQDVKRILLVIYRSRGGCN